MNERIKELLNECTQSGFDKPWPLVDHEKFAELIIKECLNVVKEVRDDCWTELSTETVREYMKAQSDDTMIAIKRHFGMK